MARRKNTIITQAGTPKTPKSPQKPDLRAEGIAPHLTGTGFQASRRTSPHPAQRTRPSPQPPPPDPALRVSAQPVFSLTPLPVPPLQPRLLPGDPAQCPHPNFCFKGPVLAEAQLCLLRPRPPLAAPGDPAPAAGVASGPPESGSAVVGLSGSGWNRSGEQGRV